MKHPLLNAGRAACLLATAFFFLHPSGAFCALNLPAIFSDAAVLQCHKPLRIWGAGAAPSGDVTVKFAEQTKTVKANADGAWSVELAPVEPGGPFELTVESGGEKLARHDLLAGEVWLLSGQSNMELALSSTDGGNEDAAAAGDPRLRFFAIQRDAAAKPAQDLKGEWEKCTPDSSYSFSAAGYYFAQKLRAQFGPDMPIGLIRSTCWGSACEPWVPRAALESDPDFAPLVQALDTNDQSYIAKKAQWDKEGADNTAKYQASLAAMMASIDAADAGLKEGWQKPGFDDSSWTTFAIPGQATDDYSTKEGTFWLRHSVDIPAEWAGKDLWLMLSTIDQDVHVYVDGEEIKDPPETKSRRLHFRIPGKQAHAGKMSIALRIVLYNANPFVVAGAHFLYRIEPVDGLGGQKPVPLNVDWKFKVGGLVDRDPKLAAPRMRQLPSGTGGAICGFYNAMVAPITQYAIRGVLWYQGEANTDRAAAYHKLFPLLIHSWRQAWGDEKMPFYFVQLSGYLPPVTEPVESDWAALREAQLASLSVPDTGMAVAADLSDPGGAIHPRRKKEVGERLALIALNFIYGHPVPYSGPIYSSMKIEGGKIRMEFKFTDGGLKSASGDLKGFAIAGEDKHWVWANAKVEKDTVVAWSDAVPNPVAVRYAWATNPVGDNLENGVGLPASPFRTDQWELGKEIKQVKKK